LVAAWLIRHGESEGNAGFRSSDPASIALTDLGHRQAQAAARGIPTRPERIVTSSYVRAQQTAAPLRERYPDVETVEWPVEEFTFLPSADYRQTTARERARLAEKYWEEAKPRKTMGDGAESFAAFIERVLDVRGRLLASTKRPIALYSHRKFLSALIWVLLTGEPKISPRRMRRYRGFDAGLSIKNAAIIPLVVVDGRIHVLPVDTAHLEGDS
jgi:broad specificity phosphatase PhoE